MGINFKSLAVSFSSSPSLPTVHMKQKTFSFRNYDDLGFFFWFPCSALSCFSCETLSLDRSFFSIEILLKTFVSQKAL